MNDLRLLLRVLCVVIFVSTPGLPSLLESAPGAIERLRAIEQQVHREVNHARLAARVPQLSWNEKLAVEARRHASNMAGRRFFAHEDPARGDLARRLDRSGIDWQRCAENLYSEKTVRNPAADAVKAWMESPGHRKNMLDSWLNETGVGVAVKRDGTLLIVQEYVSR